MESVGRRGGERHHLGDRDRPHAAGGQPGDALRVRPDVPFACAGGVCGTCRAKLVTGTVTMDENYALEQDELDKGYVLTCQSHPTSKDVTVDFDV
ncbi:UNVERIFIED_ORG: Na+-transporting NADH:ubiquinone oxidoreductase subunit NqrF [Arthrobacter sp. UYEF10]